MDSLRNVSEWEERLERIAHGGVNALVGHVFPLFQMVEGSGAPGAGNDPVQPRMDDQGVASRMTPSTRKGVPKASVFTEALRRETSPA